MLCNLDASNDSHVSSNKHQNGLRWKPEEMFPDQARLIARVVPNAEYGYEDPWGLNPAKQGGDRGGAPAVGDR
eukprot:7015842-Pyramimonas_sp.AAC.1